MDERLTYTKKEAGMFLTGLFGQNLIYNVVTAGLYYYFQNVICLPAVALGWIFAIARIWDAINDPMMGSIVDRTRTKWGKCKPYLLFAPLVICVVTCVAFLNGNYAVAKENGNTTAMALIVTWAAVSYVLWGMSYTAGDVPLWGVISRMSEVEKDRANLIALARIVSSVAAGLGIVSVVALSQVANKAFGESENAQKGFIVVGIAMTIVSSILFECAGLGVKERVPNTDERKTMKESFALMWNCKPFRRLLISGILRAPLQLLATVVMTLFTYYYCGGDLTNAFSNGKTFLTAVIIGGAFTSIVTALTTSIINPLITVIAGGGSDAISGLVVPGTDIDFGAFISACINFLIVAFVVFLLVKAVNKAQNIGKKITGKEEEEAKAAPVCPYCLEEVKEGATRCSHCGGAYDAPIRAK